jgi:hypothetical protein
VREKFKGLLKGDGRIAGWRNVDNCAERRVTGLGTATCPNFLPIFRLALGVLLNIDAEIEVWTKKHNSLGKERKSWFRLHVMAVYLISCRHQIQ